MLNRLVPGLRLAIAAIILLPAHTAIAGIPDIYKPTIVEPPFSLSERVLDLTPAIAQAKALRKPLFLYLGAVDCPPCVKYQQFLEKHSATLLETYSRYVVVDFRVWLKGPKLRFKVADKLYSYDEFNKFVGAARSPLLFPHFWMISSDLRLIRPLPSYVAPFLELETHREILSTDGTMNFR